jgi:hypothetical protein
MLLQPISQEKSAAADKVQRTSAELHGKAKQYDALQREKLTLTSAVSTPTVEKQHEDDLLKLPLEQSGDEAKSRLY